MATKLTESQWDAIRTVWEFSPDEPAHGVAASIAGAKHGFEPPSKQAVQKRAAKQGWQRKASLAGINQAAHRIADTLVKSDGSREDKSGATSKESSAPSSVVVADSAKKEQDERSDSERKRAEVRARHRTEWQQVGVLRQEALQKRVADPGESFNRLKIAKITAEITAIQQQGECRAWGLDELIDPARLKSLSDDQLEALASGKSL